jgi:uncharacterized protein YqgV (UPF0045/DUF77 family)
MLAEIQVLPRPAGTPDSPYANVEAAIAIIQNSGLTYEVGALGTTIEGTPDQIWPVLRQVHEACREAGAENVISNIKIHESAGDDHNSISGLVSKFR